MTLAALPREFGSSPVPRVAKDVIYSWLCCEIACKFCRCLSCRRPATRVAAGKGAAAGVSPASSSAGPAWRSPLCHGSGDRLQPAAGMPRRLRALEARRAGSCAPEAATCILGHLPVLADRILAISNWCCSSALMKIEGLGASAPTCTSKACVRGAAPWPRSLRRRDWRTRRSAQDPTAEGARPGRRAVLAGLRYSQCPGCDTAAGRAWPELPSAPPGLSGRRRSAGRRRRPTARAAGRRRLLAEWTRPSHRRGCLNLHAHTTRLSVHTDVLSAQVSRSFQSIPGPTAAIVTPP